MKPIVAIETSFDESAVAVVMDGKVLSSKITSQIKLHAEYDGVVPEHASREQLKNLPLLFKEALDDVGLTTKDLGGLCVTQGPGLKGCLLIGIGFTKGISIAEKIPMLGINHIEGHIFSPFVGGKELPKFPFLALIVSGGHTELHLVTALGEYECLIRTTDDAAGEAFDKSATLLGFHYPGGRALSESSELQRTKGGKIPKEIALPKVAREIHGFSFSGLKTAISLLVKKNKDSYPIEVLAQAIEESIVDALVYKTKKAIDLLKARNIKSNSLVVGGGVSANNFLAKKLKEEIVDMPVFISPREYATDNAAMIGWVGEKRLARGEKSALSIEALPSWRVEAKG